MRRLMLVTILSTAFFAPALAAEQIGARPSFDDCFRLGWVRGMHVEQGELPGWNEQCMAGLIPFDSGHPTTTVRPEYR